VTGTTGGVFSATGLQINAASGDIVPDVNTVGAYTINYSIAAAGGCASFSTSTKIYIGAPGTWSGKANNDWANSANWICGVIPDSTIDASIPKQVSNFPSVITHYAEAKNLCIANGASLTVSGTLKVSGAIANSGNLNVVNGTLNMNGSDAQSIAGSMFENKTIKNLVVSNTSGQGLSIASTAGDTLKLTGTLSFGNSNSILNTGNNIALISNYDGTASVSVVGKNNAINGDAIVEKYINTGTASDQHGKSWQFLSVATSGQTVKESWMENKNSAPGYGTMISGPAGIPAGFDIASAAPSLKYFNDSLNNWIGVTSANSPISNAQGYMVFVRGDRTVTNTTQAANPTVLRSKGMLFTGTQLPIKVKPGKFQSIGNPYASAIDFAAITKDTVIDDAFYVYDPYLYGNYGVGGYQTLSSVNNWKPVPGGTVAYPTTVLSSIIQSGQAFFVHSHGEEIGSVTLTEDCKSATSRPGHSNRMAARAMGENKQFLRASLITGTGLMADGNVVAFDKTYNDNVDGNDAIKITNSGENFAVKTDGKLLTIEAKSPLSSSDTIYYNMSNLTKTNYQIVFAPENLESSGLQAYLIDKFLNTETPVSLSDSTFINIAITSGAGATAADRFKVVFRQMKALPVTVTSITAVAKEGNNLVQWSVANESGIKQYQVEKSKDANSFSQVAVINAANNGTGNYAATDKNVISGANYYRVKIISVDGKETYTKVVKVVNEKQHPAISIYPNPITNEVIHLQLTNQPAGIYKIKLYNSVGQVLLSKSIAHVEGNSEETINCANLPKGIYQLKVNEPDGNEDVVKFVY
jgi:hypothetical protein